MRCALEPLKRTIFAQVIGHERLENLITRAHRPLEGDPDKGIEKLGIGSHGGKISYFAICMMTHPAYLVNKIVISDFGGH